MSVVVVCVYCVLLVVYACRGFVSCAMLVFVVVGLFLRDVEVLASCVLCVIAVLCLGPWFCMVCCWVFVLLFCGLSMCLLCCC